jgi:arylformamidase
MIMKIIDISWPITLDMTAYKDRAVVSFNYTKTFEKDGVRESIITLGSHSGTHIDAPSHFLADGAAIQERNLAETCGPCIVLDCTDVIEAITDEVLRKHEINEGDIVLLKTRNSSLAANAPFAYDFIYLAASGAAYLSSKKIKAVGIDYLGIERQQPHHETHITLMQNGISIIEGLRLALVNPGSYRLWCLPLCIQGLEAAPARAVLEEIR